MKKLIVFTFLVNLHLVNANYAIYPKDSIYYNVEKESPAEIIQKALTAIHNDDYNYIESVIKNGILNPKSVVDGKPLIIHAAIMDKAEMLLLLATYGAMILDPICDEGKSIMEYAIEFNSVKAQAQIIIIRA